METIIVMRTDQKDWDKGQQEDLINLLNSMGYSAAVQTSDSLGRVIDSNKNETINVVEEWVTKKTYTYNGDPEISIAPRFAYSMFKEWYNKEYGDGVPSTTAFSQALKTIGYKKVGRKRYWPFGLR